MPWFVLGKEGMIILSGWVGLTNTDLESLIYNISMWGISRASHTCSRLRSEFQFFISKLMITIALHAQTQNS